MNWSGICNKYLLPKSPNSDDVKAQSHFLLPCFQIFVFHFNSTFYLSIEEKCWNLSRFISKHVKLYSSLTLDDDCYNRIILKEKFISIPKQRSLRLSSTRNLYLVFLSAEEKKNLLQMSSVHFHSFMLRRIQVNEFNSILFQAKRLN